ncbi:YibE/F family protein [Isachenkonia alkalipeptolytica]|uniref:YibE/F family protein n=1 Tax=Isachenkonia alkalipeptolytica TaxID=2565777 RepID=A0AA44BF42_9CLOT|nr:YibE/F family protein [Isachenkonia alkalipeptolytica]NBG89608.1 YibE/F family protein [Isachenkonia alkalipeptolytica]
MTLTALPAKKDLLSIVLLLAIGIAAILTSGLLDGEAFAPARDVQFERAKVLDVTAERLSEDRNIEGVYTGFQELEIEVLSGTFAGETLSVNNSIGRAYNTVAEAGMTLIVSIVEDEGEMQSIVIYEYERRNAVYLLVGLLFFVLLIVGRKKGLMSIFSLLFTGVLILFFLVPSLIRGAHPMVVGIITAVLSITGNFYLLNGWSKKTFGAIIGTSLGVVFAGLMAYVAGRVGNISGIHTPNAEQLMFIADDTGLRIQGMLFVTILISALGAVMDVGMSIASATFELYDQNREISKKNLFAAAMNVGRDIIGTMTNTLILVFVGGMLGVIIISVSYGMPYNHFINTDMIAIEVTQALSGSIGLVLTVPITAFVSANMAKFKQ